MRIIGIDPGLNATGIGIIEAVGDQCLYVFHGMVRTRPSDELLDRLRAIRDGVRDAARAWQSEAGAVEASFVGSNARSALALGQARAAALIGLADAGITLGEYTPAIVKQTVAGYGRGEKSQVAEMVRIQLGLASLPAPHDASDALAVAITHWAHLRRPQLLGGR
jgi:crossover junction endodeoxyribonuclease RuvC